MNIGFKHAARKGISVFFLKKKELEKIFQEFFKI